MTMLEQEAERLLLTITDRTIGTRDSITVQEILAADIPRGVKVYFRAEVMRWLREDLSHAPRFAALDSSSPESGQMITAFLRSLCTAYRFPRDAYKATLENAVNFVGNYLCRPQWTLEQFMFEEKERASTNILLEKTDYFADYSYFGRLLERIIHQRSIREMGVEDFRHWVAKIDDQIVKQHSAPEMAQLARPIFDFVNFGGTKSEAAVPLKPVLAFFEDKKMKILKEYIESICHLRDQSTLTLAELQELIEDLYLGSPIEQFNDGAVERTGGIEIDESPDSVPNAQPTGQEESEEGGEPEPPAPDHPPEELAPPEGRSKQNFPLSLTYAGLTPADPAAEPQLADLNNLISEKDRNKFVKKIFRKDDDYFSVVVTSLNTIHTWKEASVYLSTLFDMNHLDPFSPDVVEFTDIVQKRYAEREGEH